MLAGGVLVSVTPVRGELLVSACAVSAEPELKFLSIRCVVGPLRTYRTRHESRLIREHLVPGKKCASFTSRAVFFFFFL